MIQVETDIYEFCKSQKYVTLVVVVVVVVVVVIVIVVVVVVVVVVALLCLRKNLVYVCL